MCEQTICRVVTSAQSTDVGAAEWSAVCSRRPCHGITVDVMPQSRQACTSMTARPITPAPKTATVAPLCTLAVFSTAPHPVSLRAVYHYQLLSHNSIVCMCYSNSHPGTYEAVADVGWQRLDADLLYTPTPGQPACPTASPSLFPVRVQDTAHRWTRRSPAARPCPEAPRGRSWLRSPHARRYTARMCLCPVVCMTMPGRGPVECRKRASNDGVQNFVGMLRAAHCWHDQHAYNFLQQVGTENQY